MKKVKSLNFLNSKWLMIPLFVFGLLLFGNVDASAQNSLFGERITAFEELRDSFTPSSAKYDITQDAIDYLEILDQQVAANPNYLNDLADQSNISPLNADKLRKTHPSILANYTAAQLASLQTLIGDFNAGINQDAQGAKKAKWILEANAY